MSRPLSSQKRKKTPSKDLLSAISNLVNTKEKEKNTSKGNSVPNSISGDNNRGNGDNKGGGKGNYQLGDRTPIKMPRPEYDCEEQGRVVVGIIVNREGKVISADPGIKGTTNSAPCLLKNAKIAALKTTWKPNYRAPERQQGKIIYNFYIRD